MAGKRLWIGCGTLIVIAVAAVVLVIVYFAGRAADVAQGIEHARDRYAESSREFPFTAPQTGELDAVRFSQYLQVRKAVALAMAPLSNGGNVVSRLSVLTSLPEEVSRVHVEALREQSMSIDEYRWITRQLYTTVAAEPNRTDADPEIRDLQRTLGAAQNRNGISAQGNASRNAFEPILVDFTWLRVPDATREIIRQNAREIAGTANAVMADTLLLNAPSR